MTLMHTMDKARRKLNEAVAGEQGQDILDTLKEEHDQVAELLGRLVENENATTRRSLLKQIKAALVPHLRAEEKTVYDPILAVKGKQERQDGEEGYLEHNMADKMLDRLGKMDKPNSPEFSAGAKVLKELVEHHVEEEEKNIWRDVREHFSDEERMDMNRRFMAAKARVRVG
jgi:hemerythrin-like domain-containing protein